MEKLQKKRGTDIPLLFVEVVRITFEEEIAVSPRVCANPYTLLPLFEISHVSTNKTSITLRDFTMKSKCKIIKKNMKCMEKCRKYLAEQTFIA